jgi:hypothetical protein
VNYLTFPFVMIDEPVKPGPVRFTVMKSRFTHLKPDISETTIGNKTYFVLKRVFRQLDNKLQYAFTEKAEEALTWINYNGMQYEIELPYDDPNEFIVGFHDLKDAALFKLFWL